MTDTDATNFLPSIDAVDRIRERLRARRMPMGSQHPDALCLLADEILEAQSTELASLRARLAQAEVSLAEVREALFPPLRQRDDGAFVDSSADENLDAAIIDLEMHDGDKIVVQTLKNVLQRLQRARAWLDAGGMR